MRYDYYLKHNEDDYRYFGTIYAEEWKEAQEKLCEIFIPGALLLVDEIKETTILSERRIQTEVLRTISYKVPLIG